MSSLGRISKGLFKERFTFVTKLFGIQILILVATQLWSHFSTNMGTTSFTGNIVMFTMVMVAVTAVMNEKIITNDKYRLIPVSDGVLYGSSLLTAFVSLLYFTFGEIVIYLIAYWISPNRYDQMMINDFNSVQQYFFKFEVLIAFILGIIVVWTGVTALHLLINWVNDFLPFRSQTISKVIVAIVIVWAFMIPFNFVTGNVLRFMGINDMDSSFAAVSHVMYSGMGMMVIWIVIFSAINLYLLNKKSETTI